MSTTNERAAIEAEARRAGVAWNAERQRWVCTTTRATLACPSSAMPGQWFGLCAKRDDYRHHPTELDALRALPSCDAWVAESATMDRAQVAALGAAPRRMVDAYTQEAQAAALEALLRHHDPAVVAATTQALEEAA